MMKETALAKCDPDHKLVKVFSLGRARSRILVVWHYRLGYKAFIGSYPLEMSELSLSYFYLCL
jgi:hypothetical protein